MNFSSLLNQYMTQMNCTAKELSEKTGLSTATLSRYRSGERVPNSEQLHKLLTGISTLAQEKQPKPPIIKVRSLPLRSQQMADKVSLVGFGN